MKKSLGLFGLLGFLVLSFSNFISAQSYGSRYSLGELLGSINPNTLLLVVIFLISFTLIYFASLKFFKGNKGFAGVISFALSLSIAYGVNRMNLDLSNLFYRIGFSEEVLFYILPILIIGALVFLFIRIKRKHNAFFILGGLLIVLSFTDFIYEKGILFVMGIISLVVAIWLSVRVGKREKGKKIEFKLPS